MNQQFKNALAILCKENYIFNAVAALQRWTVWPNKGMWAE